MMDFDRVLESRVTTRVYRDEKVPREIVEEIIKAGQRAPMGMGDYGAYKFIVVYDDELMGGIREECKVFSKKTGDDMDAFYGARTLILFCNKGASVDGIDYANSGCVMENMILKATDLGLGSTYIWGALRKMKASEKLMGKLGLGRSCEILSALAIGYPEDDLKPQAYKEKIETYWK